MPVDPTGNKIAYDLGARYVLSADTAVKVILVTTSIVSAYL